MWKEKYWDFLFSKNKENFNYGEAMLLKYNNIPLLYKYSSVDEYTLSNLKSNLVWCKRSDLFNDPFDSSVMKNVSIHHEQIKNQIIKDYCQIFKLSYDEVAPIMQSVSLNYISTVLINALKVSGVSVNQEQIEALNSNINELVESTKDLYEDHIAKISEFYQKLIFVTCFSEDPLSVLMWSHYSNNHKGICIEYDFSKLEFYNSTLLKLHPVRYSDNLVDLVEFEEVQHVGKTLLAALNKSCDWEYEKEWRIVLDEIDSKDEGKALEIIQPKSIILGSRISDSDKAAVLKIASSKNIEVKQIKVNPHSRKLSIDFI